MASMREDLDPEPLDKLREVSQQLVKSSGEKALSTAGDKLSGLTDKLEGIAGGGPVGKAVEKGAKAKAEGDSAADGRPEGRRLGHQGQDHRRWRQGRRRGQGHEVHEHHRDHRRRRSGAPSPTTSGPSSAPSRAS